MTRLLADLQTQFEKNGWEIQIARTRDIAGAKGIDIRALRPNHALHQEAYVAFPDGWVLIVLGEADFEDIPRQDQERAFSTMLDTLAR